MLFKDSKLSVREREVAYLVLGGASNREIGARLSIKSKTVVHHCRNLYRKLGVRNRSEFLAKYRGKLEIINIEQSTEALISNTQRAVELAHQKAAIAGYELQSIKASHRTKAQIVEAWNQVHQKNSNCISIELSQFLLTQLLAQLFSK